MESLKLNVGALVPQEIHHELQVLWFTDVPCHDCEIVSVEEQFTQQLSHKHMMLMTGQAPDDRNQMSEHTPSTTVSWSRSSQSEAVSRSYQKPGRPERVINKKSQLFTII